MAFPDGGGPLRVNPIALVMVAVAAGAALPYLGPLATGAILSAGLLLYGLALLRQGQRALGLMFASAAIAIVLALWLR